MIRLLLPLPALLLAGAAVPSGVDVYFDSLRSSRGVLRLCLNSNPAHYPDCSGDPQARRINVPANSGSYRFNDLPPGTYALTALHDENGDGRLNTFLGIPREGFAFSNNPRVGFGPPSFQKVRFNIGSRRGLLRLRFKYIA